MTKLEDQDWVINPNTGKKIDMKALLTEQRLALIYVDSRFPFFSSLLRNLTWIYTFQVKTQATDGTRLLVNPEFTSELSIKMKAFVMMHECMHCALDHMKRGKNHDRDRSNVAADYEVNYLLVQDGIVSASDISRYLYDKKYEGMNYEHIYALNPPGDNPPPPQKGGQQGSGNPQGGGQGQGQQGQGQQGQGKGQQGQGGGPSDKDIDKMTGEEAAASAQGSADRAQAEADKAKSSGNSSAAKKAQSAADKAKAAADAAADAASKGDTSTARQKAKEARDAANEAASANGSNQGNGSKGGKGQNGDGQASEKYRKEAAEACGSIGGFISQEAGAEIAKSEGYPDGDCKVQTTEQVSQDWKDATIEACSKNNSPGVGNIVSHFKDYYLTSHDWKADLKKYVGRALNNVNDDTKLGKKKWLAQGEIRKFNKPSEDGLDSVIFLIDCSGSVSDKLLQNIISECWTICVKKKIRKVTYCYYDDGLRQIETNDTMHADGVLNKDMISRIRRGNARPIADIHGRGGNEEDRVMDDIVKIIKQSHKRPELMMWFTDGYTYARPVKPSCVKHMIWVIYDNNNFEVKDNSRVIHISSADMGK